MGVLIGVVLRSEHASEVVKFYERLLSATPTVHAHGGPQHVEIGLFKDDSVLELYGRSANHDEDAIMVEVEDLEQSLTIVVECGGTVVSEKATHAYVRDPDGRLVLLLRP